MMNPGLFLLVWCCLTLAATGETTALTSSNYEDVLVKDEAVWLVRFSDTKVDDFEAGWAELDRVVQKAKKGEVDVSTASGKELAALLSITELPAMALFNAGAQPTMLTEGPTVKSVKTLKKLLKKGFKGLEKDDAGLFKRKQNCDADDGTGKTAKYLMYDVGPGERFNMRKAVLTERVIPLMVNLKKIDPSWTLVLSPFRQFGESTFERWSDMFDTEKMKGLVPGMQMLEAVDYLAWRKRIDQVIFLGSECPPGIEDRSDFDHSMFGKPCTIGQCKCSKDYRPDAADESFAEAVDKYVKGASVNNPKAVLLTNFENVMPMHVSGVEKEKIKIGNRAKVVFNDNINAAAADFHTKIMGGDEFVSMHWRQGDFLRSTKDLPSLEVIGKGVADKCKELGLTNFLLLTNGDQNSVERLSQMLNAEGVKLYRFAKEAYESKEATDMKYPGQDGYSSLQVAAIEQSLAAKGKTFIGTSTSTFSKQIHLERRVLGHSWTDESCVTLLGDGAFAKMCDYTKPGGGPTCETW
jgi:hypothetical protein